MRLFVSGDKDLCSTRSWGKAETKECNAIFTCVFEGFTLASFGRRII